MKAQEVTPSAQKVTQARRMTVPRLSAMGNAGIGGSRATSALIVNPAGMLSDVSYVIDVDYFRTQQEENLLNLTVSDSQTSKNRFALGLGYQGNLSKGDFIEHHAQIGIAMPLFKLGDHNVLGGVNAHYLYQAEDKSDLFDIDLGIMLPLGRTFSIGAVGARLLSDEQQWGAGLGFIERSLSAHLDIRGNFETSSTLNAGIEWLLSDRFVVRGGYLHTLLAPDTALEGPYAFTLGAAILGFGNGRGRVNLSYQRSITSDQYLFGAGFSLYLDDHRKQLK